jgi:hypothetical protein
MLRSGVGAGGDRYGTDEAVGGDPLDRGVVHLDAAVFEIEGSPAILGWSEGFQWRALEDRHGNS